MKTNYLKKAIAAASIFTLSLSACGQIIPNGTYVIYSAVQQEVLITNPNNNDEAEMGVPDLEGDDTSQHWSFVHQGNDIYNITNVSSGNLLGVADRWCGDFGNVRAQANADDGFDLRIASSDSQGLFLIEIAYDNECNFGSVNDPIKAFDVDGGNSGAQVNTFGRNPSNPNQQFNITPPATAAVLSVDEVSLLDFIEVFFSKELGLTIRTSDSKKQNLELEIYDTSGSTVYTNSLESIAGNELNLKLEDLQTGVYFVKIENEQKQSSVTKIVIF